MQVAKLKKIRIVFATILVLFTIFSLYFSTVEKNHNCSGSDCPICYVIEISKENIELLKFAKIFLSVILIHPFVLKINFQKNQKIFSFSLSPISQKIRIND